MGRSRRRKRRTQDITQENAVAMASDNVPKSFVFSHGKLPVLLRNLVKDLRKVMSPHTARNLRESNKNSLNDFVHVAALFGVTHFMIISSTKESPYLRLACCPRGPTLTFRIHAYSLSADITRLQNRPRTPLSAFRTPPLVLMKGLTNGEEHLKLVAVVFQNLVPPVIVNTAKLSNCRRVLLLNYDKESKFIDLRHYFVSAHLVGVTRNIRKLMQHKELPNLCEYSDVSEFVKEGHDGSDSEGEEDVAKVELFDDLMADKQVLQRNTVRLREIGPRLTLQLVKIEESLNGGAVVFHEFLK